MDGKSIRALRMRLGISQRQLGERLGVDQGTVSRWERGVESPRPARQGRMHDLLARSEERRHLMRSLAMVRNDLMPATLTDGRLRLTEASDSARRYLSAHRCEFDKIRGISFDRYADRIGLPALVRHLDDSGLLEGDALLFRFSINACGSGNTTIWEPIFEDGCLVGVLNYISARYDLPAEQGFALERVDFLPTDNPGTFVPLHSGTRSSLIPDAAGDAGL